MAFPSMTRLRITGRFAGRNGANDPDEVTFEVIPPGEAKQTYVYGTDAELEREDTGRYAFEVVPTDAQAGRWAYRFIGEGTIDASRRGSFIVRAETI